MSIRFQPELYIIPFKIDNSLLWLLPSYSAGMLSDGRYKIISFQYLVQPDLSMVQYLSDEDKDTISEIHQYYY